VLAAKRAAAGRAWGGSTPPSNNNNTQQLARTEQPERERERVDVLLKVRQTREDLGLVGSVVSSRDRANRIDLSIARPTHGRSGEGGLEASIAGIALPPAARGFARRRWTQASQQKASPWYC
jgi:hypothetical protein